MRICYSMTSGKYGIWIQQELSTGLKVMKRFEVEFDSAKDAHAAIVQTVGAEHPYAVGEGVKYGLIDPKPYVGKPKYHLRKKLNANRIDDGKHVRNW